MTIPDFPFNRSPHFLNLGGTATPKQPKSATGARPFSPRAPLPPTPPGARVCLESDRSGTGSCLPLRQSTNHACQPGQRGQATRPTFGFSTGCCHGAAPTLEYRNVNLRGAPCGSRARRRRERTERPSRVARSTSPPLDGKPVPPIQKRAVNRCMRCPAKDAASRLRLKLKRSKPPRPHAASPRPEHLGGGGPDSHQGSCRRQVGRQTVCDRPWRAGRQAATSHAAGSSAVPTSLSWAVVVRSPGGRRSTVRRVAIKNEPFGPKRHTGRHEVPSGRWRELDPSPRLRPSRSRPELVRSQPVASHPPTSLLKLVTSGWGAAVASSSTTNLRDGRRDLA